VFLVDSLPTSYGYTVSPSNGTLTRGESRFLVGTADDPRFGKSTAIAYTPYYAANYPSTNTSAKFQKLSITLIFDYYWAGEKSGSEQQFEVYELTDSMLTYVPHYANQSTPYGRLLGTATHTVNPIDFDQNIIDNTDPDVTKHIIDSVNIVLDPSLGQALLDAAMDTVGNHEQDYNYFYKFRRKFKGLAFVSPNSNKIVGFNPAHTKTRMVLDYKIDTSKYQLLFRIEPSQQQVSAAEYSVYTEIRSDRSGTPLAALPSKYVDWEPSDGNRYIQAGTGIVTKLDFSEVYDYFKNIPLKALSVAELRIETDQQDQAPKAFVLRALKSNNRNLSASTQYTDAANDPFTDVDANVVTKHLVYKYDANWDKPFFRVEAAGDNGGLFLLSQLSNSGTAVYTGYLTNFLEQELTNNETDILRYFALVPQTPDIARGVNGFYFPADKIKLKIYYTSPGLDE